MTDAYDAGARRPAVAVVGAGLCGLTVASELATRGFNVTVLEREASVGGLARTFRYGERFFDVGPHRFHTADAALRQHITAVLGDEVRTIPRRSAVHAFGGLHDWPLRPRVLAALPPALLAQAALDLLRRPAAGGESFEQEMVARYGRTIYRAFFEPYTRRFTGIDPALLHRDWARAGIDRAVIDRRVRASGLGDLLRGLLFPLPTETTFLYPERGIGRFADRLAERIVAAGGRICVGAAVSGVDATRDRVLALEAGGERFPVDGVVWTAPISDLASLTGGPESALRFRSTLLFNVALRRPPETDRQWVYFGDEATFVRVSNPAAFSAAAVPPGRGTLCVERTCDEGDEAWSAGEGLTTGVVDALLRNGLIRAGGDVEEVHVERVASTYPIYTRSYRRDREVCMKGLGRLRNLVLAGRCGRFWYNNMDHSIAQGLLVAHQIADGRSFDEVDVGALDFWSDQRGAAVGSVDAGR
jgi:protoporphyrinogen oxidase